MESEGTVDAAKVECRLRGSLGIDPGAGCGGVRVPAIPTRGIAAGLPDPPPSAAAAAKWHVLHEQ
jgi:hypothetical protein